MVNALPVCVTIDHDRIEAWAERRHARPSQPEGDERPWPLLFDRDAPDAGLVEISWEKFFAEFERAGLAFVFVYRDTAPDGGPDDSYEFVKRAAVPELIFPATSTIIERAI